MGGIDIWCPIIIYRLVQVMQIIKQTIRVIQIPSMIKGTGNSKKQKGYFLNPQSRQWQ